MPGDIRHTLGVAPVSDWLGDGHESERVGWVAPHEV
jgi:hypothetical protein